jgi:hypothetical protein
MVPAKNYESQLNSDTIEDQDPKEYLEENKLVEKIDT